MISRLTIRLFIIVSLITFMVMASFVAVRYMANTELMQNTATERGMEVAKRVAASVKPTIWNIYNKAHNRSYTVEFADAVLDAELNSDFIQGIKVFGNFGHLYMGKFKYQGSIRRFSDEQDEVLWKQLPDRLRYPVSQGTMTIGYVEISFSNTAAEEALQQSLWVDITQVAIVSLLVVFSLYIALRLALMPPMRSLQVAQHSLDALDEAVLVVNQSGDVIDINPSYTTMTQYSEAEARQKQPEIYLDEARDTLAFHAALPALRQGNGWSGAVSGKRKDGSHFPGWLTFNVVAPIEGQLEFEDITYVGVLTDITDKLEAERQLHQLAYFDSLTNIPNRHAFMQQLESGLQHTQARNGTLALLFIDLDNFKWINDSFGHDAGDALLQAVAQRLQETLNEHGRLFRLGGDEFTVIIDDYANNNSLFQQAQQLVTAITLPFNVLGHKVQPGASIGIATFPVDGDNALELIKCADSAMFQAKEQGRGQACFFSCQLDQQRQQEQRIAEGLKKAIAQDELQLYFQPKCALLSAGFRVVGAEALLRWQRDGTMVCPPDAFIPVAEQSNLICEIGYWVIEQACQQIAHWKRMGLDNLTIAVNLSPRQLRDTQLFDLLTNCLQRWHIRPGELELEITESAVIEDIASSIKTLNRLQSLGITIAMDDFGTGYSSLAYLDQLPIEVLKIDRSFINTISDSGDKNAVIKAIFSMAQALELDVVAEGVENQQQLDFLIANRCQIGQGYFFAKPMTVADFEQWLHTHNPLPLLEPAMDA